MELDGASVARAFQLHDGVGVRLCFSVQRGGIVRPAGLARALHAGHLSLGSRAGLQRGDCNYLFVVPARSASAARGLCGFRFVRAVDLARLRRQCRATGPILANIVALGGASSASCVDRALLDRERGLVRLVVAPLHSTHATGTGSHAVVRRAARRPFAHALADEPVRDRIAPPFRAAARQRRRGSRHSRRSDSSPGQWHDRIDRRRLLLPGPMDRPCGFAPHAARACARPCLQSSAWSFQDRLFRQSIPQP